MSVDTGERNSENGESEEMKSISLRYKDTCLLVNRSLALESMQHKAEKMTAVKTEMLDTNKKVSSAEMRRYNMDISHKRSQTSTVCTLS